ncbi:TlpA disulfide reductase family protein [Polaribacter sp. L3A8]|uniref:TlpA disulfide reductase family protein n=1 Tax=Polaribacter sp. L3A8 TaxID=2686361 RepID=UPI00131B69C6|nr:TlpA disulfide reductase family protein [Polaribacter sp. L3A8]
MRKLLFLIGSFFIFLTSCNSVDKKEENHKGYTIKGVLSTTDTPIVYLINEQDKKIDSSIVIDNTFSFKGIVTTTKTHHLQLKNKPKKHAIVLENSKYTILINDDKATISGGNLNNKQVDYSNLQNDLDTKKLVSLNAFIKEEIKLDSLQKSIKAIELEKKEIAKSFLISNANNVLSSTLFPTIQNFNLEELKEIKNNTEVVKTNTLTSLLDDEISKLQKIVDEELAEKNKIAAAKKVYRKPAIMFSGDGLKGELISLETIIKGKKVILVDFWASWCGPCRLVTPRVKELYHKYKNKGFTILTVSEDKNKEDWKRGIEQDGMLSWYHIFDDYGRISTMHGIRTIPYMVLIDGNGGVIKEKISITELEYQLQKLL